MSKAALNKSKVREAAEARVIREARNYVREIASWWKIPRTYNTYKNLRKAVKALDRIAQ